MTLDAWLTLRFPTAKRLTLRRMLSNGRVTVNGRRAHRLDLAIADTDVVAVDESRTGAVALVRDPRLTIVHEDADLLIVNKPPGLLTSTGPREKRATLLALVREYVSATSRQARVGLIHRLDRDASGLLVFSKSDAAYQSLKTQFYHHSVERVYHAVVHGNPKPSEGRIESRLVERADGIVYSTRQTLRGESAVTHYFTVKSVKKRALVRVMLETGRKHQIRVHLSEKGWPIVGDPLYGPPAPSGEMRSPHRLLLMATRLGLVHPQTGKAIDFELPLPDDFAS